MEASPNVPDEVVEFLDRGRVLTLATAGSGGPPHATTLVYVNDGAAIYIWLRSSSDTTGKLRDNPEVGFAIAEYADDWRQTKGLQGTGTAAAVSGDELGTAGDLFGRRFPDLRPGATSAATFFRIVPTELNYIDNTRGEGDPEPDEYRRESVL